MGFAQDAELAKPRTGAASPFDFGGVNVFEHAIPNAAGKSLVVIHVTYPPRQLRGWRLREGEKEVRTVFL
jgi:hypothetical protein